MTKEMSMIQKSRKITGLTLLGYKNKTDDLRISSVPITHFFKPDFYDTNHDLLRWTVVTILPGQR